MLKAKKSSGQSVAQDHGVLELKTEVFFERAKVSVNDSGRGVTAEHSCKGMGLGLGCTIRTRLAVGSCSHVVFAMHLFKLDMTMFQVSVCK